MNQGLVTGGLNNIFSVLQNIEIFSVETIHLVIDFSKSSQKD